VRARRSILVLGSLVLAGSPILVPTAAGAAPPTCDGHAVTINLNEPMSPGGSPAAEGGDPIHYHGTSGPDVILGTSNGEIIDGLGGNDRICAGIGLDVVNGGPGQDRLFGGSNDDRLRQNGGGGLLAGGNGADTLRGGSGNDTLRGGRDSDTLLGLLGNDALDGGTGVSIILDPPDTSSDNCNGGPGHDTQLRCETSSNFP
jgi:Ca2+-binding RTX toxin-like protein